MTKVSTLVLYLILEEKLSTFHHYDVSCELIIYGLYYAEVRSFYTYKFVKSFFYHEQMLSFVKCFFCVYRDDHMIFFFHSINVMHSIYLFAYIELSLYPRGKSYLIIVNDLFNVLLNSVC